MHIQAALLLSLLGSTFALPTTTSATRPVKRAILSPQQYSQFQVSNGVGGNALAEVKAKFPFDETNLASIDPVDLEIIKAAGETAEKAETGAGGFNEAIAAAGGTNSAAGKVLQVGKIKNKVLKLQLSVLRLGTEVAQGRQDRAAKLQEQRTKLAKNVELDRAAAGQRSQGVNFQGSSQPRR
ncbi:hypothetical protein QBC39DRAFT_425149 [Podospora conica]|nr:hypothetical protein QBC39DRAFT_425149 [Schizothecium conicum]